MSARDEMREAVIATLTKGDWISPRLARDIVDAALAVAIPRIETETVERCAKVAEQYGPSRPMATNMAFSIIRGRWEGEQAASANIAAAIRNQEPNP